MDSLRQRMWATRVGYMYRIAFVFLCVVLFFLLVPEYWHKARAEMSHFIGAKSEYVSCANLGYAEKNRCWEVTVYRELAKDKVVATLNQLKYFSSESPDFVQSCHSLAHLVGEKAYKDFTRGEVVASSPAMQVCDFGFYHGFMTAFISESRNFKELGEFCDAMPQIQNDGQKSYSRAACFHGIGHGSVTDHNPEEWKDPFAVLSKALIVCHSAAQTEKDFSNCAGGAYNGMSYGPYKEQIDPKNPFKICDEVGQDGAPLECYANLASVVFNLTPDKSIREAIDLASPHATPEYLLRMIPTFANMAARQIKSDQQSVATCRELPGDQEEVCFSGYVIGLVQSEVPDTKEKRAYDFCAGNLLPEDRRVPCFGDAFDVLASFWEESKIESSCKLAPKSGADACQKALVLRAEARARE